MIWVLAGVLVFLATVIAVLAGVALMLPAASEAAERVRIRRELEDAAWNIHTRATAAFGEMLRASRQEAEEPSKGSEF